MDGAYHAACCGVEGEQPLTEVGVACLRLEEGEGRFRVVLLLRVGAGGAVDLELDRWLVVCDLFSVSSGCAAAESSELTVCDLHRLVHRHRQLEDGVEEFGGQVLHALLERRQGEVPKLFVVGVVVGLAAWSKLKLKSAGRAWRTFTCALAGGWVEILWFCHSGLH